MARAGKAPPRKAQRPARATTTTAAATNPGKKKKNSNAHKITSEARKPVRFHSDVTVVSHAGVVSRDAMAAGSSHSSSSADSSPELSEEVAAAPSAVKNWMPGADGEGGSSDSDNADGNADLYSEGSSSEDDDVVGGDSDSSSDGGDAPLISSDEDEDFDDGSAASRRRLLEKLGMGSTEAASDDDDNDDRAGGPSGFAKKTELFDGERADDDDEGLTSLLVAEEADDDDHDPSRKAKPVFISDSVVQKLASGASSGGRARAGDAPADDDDDDRDNDTAASADGGGSGGGGQTLRDDIIVPKTTDMTVVRKRIDSLVKVLGNFKELRKEGISRASYMGVLLKDISHYYSYSPWLVMKLLSLFSVTDCIAFIEAQEVSRPVTIRTNTLKTRRKDLIAALKVRGITLEALKWSKIGIQVFESVVPIGATPEYLSGHYMIQAASSYLPCMVLDAQPGERILDLSAAPGGKTTYIAQMMENRGTLVANDVSKDRSKAVMANLHRMGVRNTIVVNYDGRKFPQVVGGFDRVLLDAPCTGLGVISRDPSIKTKKGHSDVRRCCYLQKALLLAAIDSVDSRSTSGAVIVYSTCSITVEENEEVINYALRKRHVRIVDTGLPIGLPGMPRWRDRRFHPSVQKARRVYPHVHNMDGFFVAKLVKYDNKIPPKDRDEVEIDSGDFNALPFDQNLIRRLRRDGEAVETPVEPVRMRGRKKGPNPYKGARGKPHKAVETSG